MHKQLVLRCAIATCLFVSGEIYLASPVFSQQAPNAPQDQSGSTEQTSPNGNTQSQQNGDDIIVTQGGGDKKSVTDRPGWDEYLSELPNVHP